MAAGGRAADKAERMRGAPDRICEKGVVNIQSLNTPRLV